MVPVFTNDGRIIIIIATVQSSFTIAVTTPDTVSTPSNIYLEFRTTGARPQAGC